MTCGGLLTILTGGSGIPSLADVTGHHRQIGERGIVTPRLFLEIARRSFRRSSTYRLATLAALFTNTVFGFLRAAVLLFLADGGTLRGMSGAQLVTFAFLSQGFIAVVGVLNGDPLTLGPAIKSGDIVIDLYRPAGLQQWYLAQWVGDAGFQILARGVPPLLVGSLVYQLVWPDVVAWPVFAVSLLLASLLGFALRFVVALSGFWVLDSRGIDATMTLIISFFAGLVLPLNLFPPALEAVARRLPFAGMIQLPGEIFLGTRSGAEALSALAFQLVWLVALLTVGVGLLRLATRRLVVQGG